MSQVVPILPVVLETRIGIPDEQCMPPSLRQME